MGKHQVELESFRCDVLLLHGPNSFRLVLYAKVISFLRYPQGFALGFRIPGIRLSIRT